MGEGPRRGGLRAASAAPKPSEDIDPASVTSLEDYLSEFHTRIMKKLKEVGATADRTNFYV